MSSGNRAQVESVMTSPVETISADTSVREAATRMRDNEFSSLLVPGAETGIITSTDILDAVADGRDLDDSTVADLMTAPVESATTRMGLDELAAMMTNYGINHLPVRDDDGDYVGIVSSTDLRETLV